MFRSIFLILCILGSLFTYSAGAIATSLYDKKSYSALTADKRARKVGDVLTIIVLENSEAGSSAGTKSDSGFDIDAGANAQDKQWRYGVGVESSSEGDAKTSRNGFIKSQITAVVIGEDTNGNLVIQGTQTITIDGETQKIQIKGKVRKEDIFANNTLLSSRIFDADIKYIGEGDVSDGKEPSSIYKFFKWLGLV